jgi:predicted nucleotidyltransferase
VLIKDNNYNVMKLFFDNPDGKFHIREIARRTSLSAPGVSKILRRLKKEALLVSKKENLVENFEASRSEKFFWFKKCYNFLSFYESGLVDFLRDKYEEPEAIVVFGSYSNGEDTAESDIDVAVVTKKSVELDLKRFESLLKRRIHILEIQPSESDKEFLNSLANGTVVYGFFKVLQ